MPLSRSLTLAVLACAMVVGGCDRQSAAPAQQGEQAGAQSPAAGKPAPGTFDTSHKGSALPDFTLSDPSGKQLPLVELKGQPLLVNLWATWCAPCVVELPLLDKLAQEHKGKLRVLTVSQDMTQTEKVAPFLAEKGGAMLEAWLDPQNDLSFHYATGTLPTTILYDAEGREVWRLVGEHDWGSAETARMLEQALR